MTAITVSDLRRTFIKQGARKGWLKREPSTEFVAVDGISFEIERGERVAFIGPNGAGKSTTLKMLTGILHPTAGDASVMGMVPWQEREQLALRLGIVFGQRSQLWGSLPARDSLSLLARIYGLSDSEAVKRLDELAELFRISHLLEQPVQRMSLGQRMRCEIAAALLHAPDVLFLDEPTIGLDVTAKALLRDHLKELATRDDLTVMLTSHDMGDIEEICPRVIIIDHGKLLMDGTIAELKAQYLTHKTLDLVTGEEAPVFDHPGVRIVSSDRHNLGLSVDLREVEMGAVVAAAVAALDVKDMRIEDMPLERLIARLFADREDAA
ncbi:MAG: ATP-binding cassette domain-containing protein [Alphaproteobacteria bacterium]